MFVTFVYFCFCFLSYVEYICQCCVLRSATITVFCMLIPSHKSPVVRDPTAQTADDKTNSASPRLSIKCQATFLGGCDPMGSMPTHFSHSSFTHSFFSLTSQSLSTFAYHCIQFFLFGIQHLHHSPVTLTKYIPTQFYAVISQTCCPTFPFWTSCLPLTATFFNNSSCFTCKIPSQYLATLQNILPCLLSLPSVHSPATFAVLLGIHKPFLQNNP